MRNFSYLLLMLFLGSAIGLQAQVTMGSQADPHQGAVLELRTNGEHGGLLLPSVILTSNVVWAPLGGNAIDGMMVFNTSTSINNGLKGNGVYYWSNNQWNPFNGSEGGGSTNVLVSAVTFQVNNINYGEYTINVGESFNLIAIIAPSNATNKAISWSSSNGNATLSNHTTSSVNVTGTTAGDVTITAAALDGSGKIGTFIVHVKNIPVFTPCPSGSYSVPNGVYTPNGAYVNVGTFNTYFATMSTYFTATSKTLCLRQQDASYATGWQNWSQARSSCSSGSGFEAWRLPNAVELGQLQGSQNSYGLGTDIYWTNTERNASEAFVWAFQGSSANYGSKSDVKCNVRCVRSVDN